MLTFYCMLRFLLMFICGDLILLLAPQVRAAPDLTLSSQICTTESALVPEGSVPTVTSTEIETSTNIVFQAVFHTITRPTPVTMVILPSTFVSFITVPPVVTVTEVTTQIPTVVVTVTTTTNDHIEDAPHEQSTLTVKIPTPLGFRRPTADLFDIFKRETAAPLQETHTRIVEAMDSRLDGPISSETSRRLHKRTPRPSRVVCTDLITVIVDSTSTTTEAETVTAYVPAREQPTAFAALSLSTIVAADEPTSTVSTSSTAIEPAVTVTTSITEKGSIRVPYTDISTTTIYDACADETLLSNLHKEAIGKVRDGPDFFRIERFEEAKSVYECCAACIAYPNCGGSSYKIYNNETETALRGRCLGLVTRGDCDPGKVVGYFDRGLIAKEYAWEGDGIHISSGHCGHLKQGVN